MRNFNTPFNGKNLSRIARGAMLALMTMCSTQVMAQCLTNNLNISTGYDPMTGTNVTPSSTQLDPKWTSTPSPDAIASITAMGLTVGCYNAPPLGTWPAAYTGTCYIMGQNDWGFNTDGNASSHFSDTFSRTFDVCVEDSVRLVIESMTSDDHITLVAIDGTPLYTHSPACYIYTYPSATYNLGTLVGTHTISIVVSQCNNGIYKNAIGLNMLGRVESISGNNSINSETCPGYTCNSGGDPGCDDKCYWRVTGNNIYGTNNKLGTLDKNDVVIITNNTNRGIIKSSGEFGIHQMSPSTTLDIDCVPPATAPSGLQFENLPTNEGRILVVDKDGYVYASKKTTGINYVGNEEDANVKAEIATLKNEIEGLKRIINQLTNGNTSHEGSSFSISPNPSDGEINATYNIVGNYTKATLSICDNLGRVILTKPIEGALGTLHVTLPGNIKSSNLIVSLIVDGSNLKSEQLTYIAK